MLPQGFRDQLPQKDSDIGIATLQGFLEVAEAAGAAANVVVFLLLKASPEDSFAQARILSMSCRGNCIHGAVMRTVRLLHCSNTADMCGDMQKLDSLAGGSLAAQTLRPLREYSLRCLAQLEPPKTAAAAPSAAAVDATASGSTAAGSAAAAVPAGSASPVVPGADDDTDAMLALMRLLHAVDCALELLGS